jgi:hypothetical protein
MSEKLFPPNPYGTYEREEHPYFAGREQALSRMHQHIVDTTRSHAITFAGRHRIGKTALLRRFHTVASPAFVSVYIPLQEVTLHDELAWLGALSQAITGALAAQGQVLDGQNPPPTKPEALRGWLVDDYLPTAFRAIRSQRRLVLLLDDAGWLAAAVEARHQPQDCFAFLHSLLSPQLAIALTIDLRDEDELGRFAPLVQPAGIHRLMSLTPEVSAELLRRPADGLYDFTDDALAAVHKATGGEPELLQRFGYHLYEVAQAGETHITPQTVKTITSAVYAVSEADFNALWKMLDRDERLVLTALGSLLYDDPLRAISTAMVESWLVQTDYPLDTTAINAAIRSLEYRELVAGTAAGLTISTGLFQKWLLENARLDPGGQPEERYAISRATWFALAAAALALVMVALMIGLNLASGDSSDNGAPPTVTLMPGE